MKKLIIAAALILIAGTAFGQTLQKGVILGLHQATITLNPDVTMNQYLDFLSEKYKPEFEKHFQGWELFIIKGDRGENENKLGWIYYIESLEARDKYIKSEGELTDVGIAAFEKIQSVWDELQKLGTFTSVYTDWVIQ